MAAIGTIYNKQNWQNLNDFDSVNSWYLSADKLTNAGGNGILQFKQKSALDKFLLKIRTNSANLKIRFAGLRSVNNINTILSLENGKAKFEFTYDGSVGVSSQIIAIESGDILEFEFIKDVWDASFTVRNITKNTSSIVNVITNVTAHHIQLYSLTECTILSIEKSSDIEFEPLNLVVGDSITYGSTASSSNLRWTTLSGFTAEGSAGDTSAEALQLIDEIVNVIKPKRVIYAMGTNDTNLSVWQNNLQNFKNKVNQKNIIFIPITPYANSNRDMTAFSDYVKANFQKYFDIFSATKSNSGTGIKSEYNAGDNVHYNNLGHATISDFVLNSEFYDFTPFVPNLGSSGIIGYIINKWYS